MFHSIHSLTVERVVPDLPMELEYVAEMRGILATGSAGI